MTTVELLKACEAVPNHKIKVYDAYGHRWIIGYEVFSNGHRYWTYCRDNSTGVIIPAVDINEIVDQIHPVRIKEEGEKPHVLRRLHSRVCG